MRARVSQGARPGAGKDRLTRRHQPFVQLGDAYRGHAEGSGLGLAISRELSQGMNGELRVRSVEGSGASFTVTLPRDAGG